MNRVGPDRLTDAERTVFSFLRQGYSYKDTGLEMHISPQSVKNHVDRAGRRLLIPGGHGLAQRMLARIDGDVLDDEKLRKLQPVQRDIVRLAIKGRSLKDIAFDLGLGSRNTVKERMRAIYDSTGASSVAELRHLLVIPISNTEAVTR